VPFNIRKTTNYKVGNGGPTVLPWGMPSPGDLQEGDNIAKLI